MESRAAGLPAVYVRGMTAAPDAGTRPVRAPAGVVYHRQGITGDYDGFSGEEGLIAFIKTGRKDDGEKN